jgi:hypothetical protein
VRLQQRRALPPERLQAPAAAALGRLVDGRRLRLGDAGVHQHHRRHRRGQAEADHPLDEAAPRQLAAANVLDQCTQFELLHRDSPEMVAGRRPSGRCSILSVRPGVDIRVGPPGSIPERPVAMVEKTAPVQFPRQAAGTDMVGRTRTVGGSTPQAAAHGADKKDLPSALARGRHIHCGRRSIMSIAIHSSKGASHAAQAIRHVPPMRGGA